MKWLTLTEIGRRAKNKKGALEVSYEHWCQLYQATAKELRKALDEYKVEADYSYCGLCRYCGDKVCRDFCPLISCSKPSLFFTAWDQLGNWKEGGDWQAWKRAAKALRDKLKELMESV